MRGNVSAPTRARSSIICWFEMQRGESMRNELTLRRAEAGDAERVLAILEDGKRSIARFGIAQWQCGYPNMDSVRADIERRACYLAEDPAGRAVGTISVLFCPDAEYDAAPVAWLTGDAAAEERAGASEPVYAAVHRCATAAEALGQGVMSFLFAQAEALARAAGRRSLRIDTHPGNAAMRGFLARQGFTELQTFELTTKGDTERDLTRIAYEKLV